MISSARGRSVAALAPLLLLAACAGPPPQAVDWNAEGRALTAYPDPYQKLWVREVSVHEVAPNTTADRTLPDERYPVSDAVARDVVTTALRGLGLFRAVDAAPARFEPGEPGLVVDVALQQTLLVHVGENDEATKAFWLWLLTGLPGHSVRDQLFEVACEPMAQVSDAATGEVLVPWQPLAAPALGPWALNFHERTSGVAPYLLSNVVPLTSISIDPDAVAREILPATLRPSLASLAELFREISFLPTSKIVLAPRKVPGVRADATADRETKTDSVALTLTLSFDETSVEDLKEIRVGGKTRLDFSRGSAAPLLRDGKLELHLDVDVPPGKSVDVELVLAHANEPEKVFTISAVEGDLRPEWHR